MRMLSDAGRVRGEFYTPDAVVDYCLAQADWKSAFLCSGGRKPAVRSHSILDPACGTGNFLLGALAKSNDKLEQVRSVYGYDIDGRAVAVARVLLLIGCSAELRARADADELDELCAVLEANVRVADATVLQAGWGGQLRCTAPLSARPVEERRLPAGINVERSRGFDVVVTNPPYLSFGSRNQTPMARSHDRFLRAEFPASSQYKIRLHSVFQELALRLAAPGADVVLLVPDAFLTGAYYERLRRLITEQAEIVSLTELPESTFADATAGRWCVAHYRKRPAGSCPPLQVEERRLPACISVERSPPEASACSVVAVKTIGRDGSEKEFAVPERILVAPDKHRFRLLFDAADVAIVESMDRLQKADAFARGHTGIRARHGQASIVSDSCSGPHWQRGIVSGAQVTSHQVEWRGHWLHIEPPLLFTGGFNADVIGNPKVLVRQTADRLIGALDSDGLYHLNNVHSFSPYSRLLLDAAFFAALINSRFWLYLYRLKSREEKRALAQIDIEMVESLPFPPKEERLQGLIARTVLEIRKIGNLSHDNRDRVLTAIERLIYTMYTLDERHVARIEKKLAGAGVSANLPSSDQAIDLLESICNVQV